MVQVMDLGGLLSQLETQTMGKDPVGKNAVGILRQVSEGRTTEAAAALHAAVADCGEAKRNENFELLLAASFVTTEFRITSDLLERRFCPDCRINVRVSGEIPEHWLIILEKPGQNEIRLNFSDSFAEHAYRMQPISWLVAVMPLLARVARSRKVPEGMAYLNQWDEGLVPGLSYCAGTPDFFLIPDNVFLLSQGYDVLKQQLAGKLTEWSRRLPVAFWRGASTGQIFDQTRGWRSLQRIELCGLSQRHPALIDAGLSSVVQMNADITKEIEASGLMKNHYPANALHHYRYLIDVDGNTNAWGGLFERLLSGSPVLKVASPKDYRQWYDGRLRPWHNYVPISADMCDLRDKIRWLGAHDDVAEKIGANGRALAYSIDYETEVEAAMDTVAAAFRSHSAERREYRNNAIRTDRCDIVTHHGTGLCYDRKSGKLIHTNRSAISPTDGVLLRLLRANGELRLMTMSGEYIVDISEDGTVRLGNGPAGENNISIQILEPVTESMSTTLFTLDIDGKFSCAEGDGRITISRDVASSWECFRVANPWRRESDQDI